MSYIVWLGCILYMIRWRTQDRLNILSCVVIIFVYIEIEVTSKNPDTLYILAVYGPSSMFCVCTYITIPHTLNYCHLVKTHALLVHPFSTWITLNHCFWSLNRHPGYTVYFCRYCLLILITKWNMSVLLLKEALHCTLLYASNEMASHLGCVPITQKWIFPQGKFGCCVNSKYSTVKTIWLALNVCHSQF